jgi:hypothetical protein
MASDLRQSIAEEGDFAGGLVAEEKVLADNSLSLQVIDFVEL